MKKILWSIYDTEAEVFSPGPQVSMNAKDAIRGFRQIASDKNSVLSQTPEHFQCWQIGEYNMATGKIKTLVPKLLLDGLQLANPNKIKEETKPDEK